MKSGFNVPLFVGLWLSLCSVNVSAGSPVAYDMDMAKEICDNLPLEEAEGIWMYPDDKVTVLVLKDEETSPNSFETYSISVVETSDARLHPGDKIGSLQATPEEGVYKIELLTERKNDFLLKPKSCVATLSKDGEAFIIKKQKAPFKGRLNLNFNRLLPGFWKIVSTGISPSANTVKTQVGMVRIYPSYDGNGSSKRKVRYL